ncbi:MAG: deoxynucleoside kinase [Ignavibacteria bacterium]|nr:deoxynucleoside kinase [Candidatus Gracilibacteria bacterium]
MSSPHIKYIAIEGVIGAGKTTLAKMLAKKMNANLVLESYEDNPFLEKFYKNPRRYALHTQMYFLMSRYKQLLELRQDDLFHEYIVSDYIFEKDKIFAYLNLADDELELYERMVSFIERNLKKPDLVIYLQSTVERLMANINKRGRTAEKNMSETYISDLNEAYNYFFFRFKASRVMIVNATEMDFVNNVNDFNDLVSEIMKPEHGNIEYFNPSVKKAAGR